MFREESYRFLVGDVVRNLGTVHNIGQRKLLQSRLRRIGDITRSQAHDSIANFESRNAISDLAHSPDDILAEYGREFVCDEQAGIPAPLVVRIESWRTALAICSLIVNLDGWICWLLQIV
jgi:hypothetical protein